jgi:hypothetical protein
MPDLTEGKHYTADDMRRARAEGERRGAQNPNMPSERDQPPRGLSEMIGSDASSMWGDPVFRREIITVATKAAQIAVRGRDEAAMQLGLTDDAKHLLIPEDKCKAYISEILKVELVAAFSGIGLDISDDISRLKTAMQLKRTFDLEENSTKLLKRVAWQAFVGFVTFCVMALGAWFGLTRK